MPCLPCSCLPCCCLPSRVGDDVDVNYALKAKEDRVTAVAVLVTAIFFFAVSFALYGVATLSPEVIAGLGFIYYIGATFVSFVGLGILIGAVSFAVSSCLKERCHVINEPDHDPLSAWDS